MNTCDSAGPQPPSAEKAGEGEAGEGLNTILGVGMAYPATVGEDRRNISAQLLCSFLD